MSSCVRNPNQTTRVRDRQGVRETESEVGIWKCYLKYGKMEIRLPLARASRLALGLGLACRETRV